MKNSKALKKQNAAPPAVQYENPWLEAAAEAGSAFGKILKFVKGEWQIGEESSALLPLRVTYLLGCPKKLLATD